MRNFLRSSEAQVGIGTLIILLSMMVVSAVAAGAILQISTIIENKASATSSDTSNEVITGLKVTEVVGYSSNSRNITAVGLSLELVPGSLNIRYDDILLAYHTGDVYLSGILHELSPNAGVNNFSVTFIRNKTNDYVLERGEIAQIWFDLEGNPNIEPLPPSKEFSIAILPIGGQGTGITKYVPRAINQEYIVDW
jgi:archaellin